MLDTSSLPSAVLLFLTRKYPPARGGMETFSRELFRSYPGSSELIHYGQSQRDILWIWLPLLVAAFRRRSQAELFHLGDGVLLFLAPLLRLFSKAPIFATVHALELLYRSRVLAHLINWGLRSVDHVVCVSEYTRQLLLERGYPAAKTSVITHGADHLPVRDQSARPLSLEARSRFLELIDKETGHRLSPLTPLSEGISGASGAPQAPLFLLTVGRLVRRKGVAWFCEQVLPSLHQRDSRSVVYLVVGDGPELERLQQLAATNPSIWLLGKVSDQLLKACYECADVFVMPNISVPGDAEGFGFVGIEAALSGLPVLASRLEGIQSAIQDGKNGRLLPPEEPSPWAQALQIWLDAEHERLAFGSEAARFTRENYCWAQVGAAYQELASKLLAASRS